MTRQHVILCEGYDDRSFWAGWLERLECRSAGPGSIDAWNEEVKNGKYLFTTPNGSFILVEPARGGGEIRKKARSYLLLRESKPLGRMIVNLDSDAQGEGPSTKAREVVAGVVRDFDGGTVGPLDGPHYVGEVQIWPVVWECSGTADTSGVPSQQTLERLAASAIVAAYSGRGDAVQRWLDDEPAASETNHKNYGMSYFAKWYAQDHGHGDFYRALWRDPGTAEQLESMLRESGAWKPVEELVAD